MIRRVPGKPARAPQGGSNPPYEANGSGERESDQGRAEKRKAGCGQRQKAVGDKVMITHDAPSESCSSELIKAFRTSLIQGNGRRLGPSGPADALEEVGQEDSSPHKTHHRYYCLEHRKFPLHSRETANTAAPCTVKRISGKRCTMGTEWGFRATGVSKGRSNAGVTARRFAVRAHNH
jgi:hypothetical protein